MEEYIKRMDTMEKELFECTGYEINTRLIALTNSLLIYQANVNALKIWYKKLNNPQAALIIWNPDNYSLMEQTNLEMQRLFSNFLSSAFSLRDHLYALRNMYYEGTEIVDSIQNYIDAYFKGKGITSFVQDFRNFVVHRGYPKLNKELKIDKERIHNDLIFNKKELLKFKKWSATSKEYIENMGDDLKMIDVVNEYNGIIEAYYDDILKMFKKYHYKELCELKVIKEKYNIPLHMVRI